MYNINNFLLFLPLFFKIKTFLVALGIELLLMSTEAVIDQPIVKQPWGCLVSMNPKYPSLELYDDEVFCGRKNPDMKIDVSTISSKHFSIKRLTKNDVPLTLVTDLRFDLNLFSLSNITITLSLFFTFILFLNNKLIVCFFSLIILHFLILS